MAQSRLEKVGSIFTRVDSLLKTGAMKKENEPIWLQIYKAFPPKYEPRYDRKPPATIVRKIFYAEDKIRAKFHKEFDNKTIGLFNLMNNNSESNTELFIGLFRQAQQEVDSEYEAYNKAVEQFLALSDKLKIKQPEKKTRTTEVAQKSELEDKVQYKSIKLNLDEILEVEEEFPKKTE